MRKTGRLLIGNAAINSLIHCRRFSTDPIALSDVLHRENAREQFTECVSTRVSSAAKWPDTSNLFMKMTDRHRNAADCTWIGSSVLVLFVDGSTADDTAGTEPWVLFTRRAFRLRAHPGEIAFPGGKLESYETAEKAALREAHEEIDLRADRVDMWGRLRPIYTRFNEVVVGNVGVLRDAGHLDELRPSNEEVQTIFIAPVSDLLGGIRQTQFRYPVKAYGTLRFCLPVFFTDRYLIVAHTSRHGDRRMPRDARYRMWGVTALILHEALCCVLGRTSLLPAAAR